MYHIVTSAFYRIYRCGVRVIRNILGISPQPKHSVPLFVSKQLYHQLKAIAAYQHQCPPNKLHPADVAAIIADLIELGLLQTSSFAQRPPQSTFLEEQAQVMATLAPLQQRLAQLEADVVRVARAVEGRAGDRPTMAHQTMSQFSSRLDTIAHQLHMLEAKTAEVLQSHSNQRLPRQEQQIQTLAAHLQQLQAGLEQIAVQRADWQQTFLTTQHQIQELHQKVERLGHAQAELRSMLPSQLELFKQETGTQWSSPTAPIPPAPRPSRHFPGSFGSTNSPRPTSPLPPSQAPITDNPAAKSRIPSHQPKLDSVIDAEILDISSSASELQQLQNQNLLDVDGITQLELCKRFGFSHHTLVRDSRMAGFSSVHSYLEAKTGFRAQRVGRWWRYYSGER